MGSTVQDVRQNGQQHPSVFNTMKWHSFPLSWKNRETNEWQDILKEEQDPGLNNKDVCKCC